MIIIKNIIGILCLISICVMSPFLLYRIKNQDVNLTSAVNIRECIYRSTHELAKIGELQINYIENSPPDCINPNYPSIHIITHINHNAWLHVVHTDAMEPHTGKPYWTFVDAPRRLFPWYTLEKDFYDAPHWSSSLLIKPLT